MSNIAFYSDNRDFIDDLIFQVEKYAPEFKYCDDEDVPSDIVVVDNNAEEYNRVRSKHKNIPLIFLYEDKHNIAENNLNITLKKPFSLAHFIDILRSANNKLDNSEYGYLNFGAYQLRPLEKEIENCRNHEVVKLTEREVSIIKYLYKYSNEYVGKNELQKNVWKYNDDVSTHTVETHIYRLRRKVEKKALIPLILTDKGGYKLNLDD